MLLFMAKLGGHEQVQSVVENAMNVMVVSYEATSEYNQSAGGGSAKGSQNGMFTLEDTRVGGSINLRNNNALPFLTCY